MNRKRPSIQQHSNFTCFWNIGESSRFIKVAIDETTKEKRKKLSDQKGKLRIRLCDSVWNGSGERFRGVISWYDYWWWLIASETASSIHPQLLYNFKYTLSYLLFFVITLFNGLLWCELVYLGFLWCEW